jgi:diacylglycerol kinase family enzyme
VKVVLVYNQKSGAEVSMSELRQLFDDANIEVTATINVTSNLKARMKKYILRGGDNCCCGWRWDDQHCRRDACRYSDQDLKMAIRNATSATVRAIDIASVNDRYFINNSSIGLYPSSLHERSRLEDVLGKWPAATWSALRSFVRFRTYEVSMQGKSFHTPFVFVGNNSYDIDAGLRRRNTLDAGLLSVYIARTRSRFKLLKIAGMAIVGMADQHSRFDIAKSTHVTIQSKHKRLKVSCDGELLYLKTPLEYNVHVKELRVLC